MVPLVNALARTRTCDAPVAQTMAYAPFAATVVTYCWVAGILKNVDAHVVPPSKEISGVTVAVHVPDKVTPAPPCPARATCAAPLSAVMDCDAGAVSRVATGKSPEIFSCPMAAGAHSSAVRSAAVGRTIY